MSLNIFPSLNRYQTIHFSQANRKDHSASSQHKYSNKQPTRNTRKKNKTTKIIIKKRLKSNNNKKRV